MPRWLSCAGDPRCGLPVRETKCCELSAADSLPRTNDWDRLGRDRHIGADLVLDLLAAYRGFRSCFLLLLGVLQHLSRHVRRDLEYRAGERERWAVELRNRRPGITPDAEASAKSYQQWYREREVSLSDQLIIDV